MGKKKQHLAKDGYQWLLFFYTVPAKPVSNRMTVWRKLMKSGAVHFKGSVYLLPFTADHQEFFQWLVAETREMGGDGALAVINGFDSIGDEEIVEIFNQARRNEYLALAPALEVSARKLDAILMGGEGGDVKSIITQLGKLDKSFAEIQVNDFFNSTEGIAFQGALARVRGKLEKVSGASGKPVGQAEVVLRSAADYRARMWTTRRKPFVDRMASAWLIKRFIDPDATFAFVDPDQISSVPVGSVLFDVRDGEFTHCGDLCTFEVLVSSFGLKDKILKPLGEIVHDLDMKDGRYQPAEAPGVEGVLNGIRKTANDDTDALSRGMAVFEMLYRAKKG